MFIYVYMQLFCPLRQHPDHLTLYSLLEDVTELRQAVARWVDRAWVDHCAVLFPEYRVHQQLAMWLWLNMLVHG